MGSAPASICSNCALWSIASLFFKLFQKPDLLGSFNRRRFHRADVRYRLCRAFTGVNQVAGNHRASSAKPSLAEYSNRQVLQTAGVNKTDKIVGLIRCGRLTVVDR